MHIAERSFIHLTFKLCFLFKSVILSVLDTLPQIAFVMITAKSMSAADDVLGGRRSLISKGLWVARDRGNWPDTFRCLRPLFFSIHFLWIQKGLETV